LDEEIIKEEIKEEGKQKIASLVKVDLDKIE